MRVLQVVSMITDDARFGGPATVAVYQARALARAGHAVTLLAAADRDGDEFHAGVRHVRRRLQRVPLYGGIAGHTSTGLMSWLRRHVHAFDAIHVHMGRDLISLPAAQIAQLSRRPTFLQTHGMVTRDDRLRSRLVDQLAARRLLSRALAVFSLTPDEDRALREVNGDCNIVRLVNGIELPDGPVELRHPPRVLFLARYHARKRGDVFLRVASLLVDRPYRPTFLMHGPDEGEMSHLIRLRDQLGLHGVCDIAGSVRPADVPSLLRSVDAYVLPSEREPFPMSALEAMSVGLPTFITDQNGLAPYFTEAGLKSAVSDGSPEQIAEQLDRILASTKDWDRMSTAVRTLIEGAFSSDAIAQQLEDCYRSRGAASTGAGLR